MSLTPNNEFTSQFDAFSNLNSQVIIDGFDQFASILSGLANVPALGQDIPLLNQSIGQATDVGQLFSTALIDQVGRVRLRASAGEPQQLRPTSNLTFKLSINGGDDLTVTLPTTFTSTNNTLEDLANDLSSALATALSSTSFAGKVTAGVELGRIVLLSRSSSITSLRFSGASALGFGPADEVNSLAFATAQQLRTAIAKAIGAADTAVSLGYDSLNKNLTFNIPGISGLGLAQPQPLNFNFDTGSLSGIQTASTIDVSSRVDIGSSSQPLTFGFSLRPLGQSFALAATTPLSALQAGRGVQIEADKATHLRVTLSNSASFEIDLRGLGTNATVADLVTRMVSASSINSTPRIAVDIDSTLDRLIVRDLTFNPAALMDRPHAFKSLLQMVR